MVNAWSLAASILDGTFDEDYPIMTGVGTHTKGGWIDQLSGEVEITIDDSNCPAELNKRNVHYKYNEDKILETIKEYIGSCLLYTSPSPRDRQKSRMPSSA